MADLMSCSPGSFAAERFSLAADELSFSAEDKLQLLRNQIEFLEGEVEEKRWAVELLRRDNEEIEFLAQLSPEQRRGGDFLYLTNRCRISELRDQLAEARRDLHRYRRALTAESKRVPA